ncbi:MAG: RNA-protein complex protein Nop10 [Candidatus Aenigmatarchaeota archaeon]
MKIRKCYNCDKYTLAETCPECGEETKNPHPPKFSPEDKHGKYRRMMKKNMKRGVDDED